jgi:hypothetical protein
LGFGVSLRASTLLYPNHITSLLLLCLLVVRTLIIAPALGALAQTHNCSKHISVQQIKADSNWRRGRLIKAAHGKNYFDSFTKVSCMVLFKCFSLRKQLGSVYND